MNTPLVIQPYKSAGADVVAVRPYDPVAAEVARDVGALVEQAVPGVRVEHVGSTAVPGCAGKGVVDLMAVCHGVPLANVAAALETLGFGKQSGGHQHGDDRPMREGAVMVRGTWYRLHVHVLAPDAPAVASFRLFRDRLRADPALLATYVEQKRRLVESGVLDRASYSGGKGEFIMGVLRPPPQGDR
jgi:GrpB-like predicted nucleotidyltransferase (UPF0157 family)